MTCRRLFLLSALLFTLPLLRAEENLIQNGTFAGGTEGWFLGEHKGASGKIEALPADAAQPARLRFSLVKAGPEHWTIQLIQGKLPLQQGQAYKVTFRARSDRYRVFGVGLQMGEAPWKTIDGKWDLSCDREWTPVEVVLTSSITSENGRLQIGNLGKNPGVLEITDVRMVPVNSVP